MKTKVNYKSTGGKLTKKNLREAIKAISPKKKSFWNTWIGDLFPEHFRGNDDTKS